MDLVSQFGLPEGDDKMPGSKRVKSRVAIVKMDSKPSRDEIHEALQTLFALLGGLRSLVPPGARRVLVKPNVTFAEGPESGITTHPWLAGLIAKAFKDLGLEVYLGEAGGTGTGMTTQKQFEVNGLLAVARELGIPLKDFKDKREETVEVKVPGGVVVKNYFIAKAVMEADFRVSVPVVKTHCETTMTCSLKNMKGALPSDELKARLHSLDLNSHLVDLASIIKPHLSIVDGIMGLMGYGPGRPGIPMNLGLLIGGNEPLSVDATCARIFGYEPYEIEHLRLAEERGLGSTQPEDTEILGEPLEGVIYREFVRPPKTVEEISKWPHIRITNEGGCTSCISGVAYALHAWAPLEKLEMGKPVSIVMGRDVTPDKDYGPNVIAIGKCTQPLEGREDVTRIAGCPPPIRKLMEQIKNKLGYCDEPAWKPPYESPENPEDRH
jgi:uncharacterized protein (DUF362 family)